jgi:hypothetical protein
MFYVISFALESPVLLNIYNQCQGINLISPVCFLGSGKCVGVVLEQKIDAFCAGRNFFMFYPGQDILEGILVYKMQIKHAEPDEFIQDKSKSIQILIAWHVENKKKLDVRVLLVEHERKFNWDENKLRKLYQKYWHIFMVWLHPTGFNCMLNDTTILVTTVNIMNGGYRWDIFISERMGDNTIRPLWVNTER